jgi:hypothetical protein
MAIPPLENRLTDMGVAAAEQPDAPVSDVETAAPITMEPSPEPTMEPVLVAGKRAALKGLLETLQDTAKAETDPIARIATPTPDAPTIDPATLTDQQKATLRKESPVRVVGSNVIVQDAAPDTLRKITDLMQKVDIEGRPPEVRPNLSLIGEEDDVKKFMAASTEHWKDWVDSQRRAGRTMEQIVDEAERFLTVEGSGKALRMAITRKPGARPFTDVESLAVAIARNDLARVVSDAAKKAFETDDPEDYIEATRLMTMYGFVNAAELGNAADYGRGLAVRRLIPGPSERRVREMQRIAESVKPAKGPSTPVPGQETVAGQVVPQATPINEATQTLEEMGGRDNVRLALQSYLSLPDIGSTQEFSMRMLRNGLDMAAEVYQSALVSNPVTHLFNILGTPIHTTMMLAERYAAAFATGDKAKQYAILAGVKSIPKYLSNAFAAGARAWKTELPADAVSKFDNDRLAVTAKNFGVESETMLGKTLDYWGKGMRLLGFRVLTTTDETYKSLLRGMEMEMISTEDAGRAFNLKLDEGGSVEEATQLAMEVYKRSLNSDATYETAAEFARIATFQDDLPGNFLASTQNFMTHPAMKLMGFPFYKTPMQIFLRIQERTPLAVAMPRFWKALTSPQTPEERSVALAKVGMGSAVGATFMTTGLVTGDEVIITGYGPSNPAERTRWLEKHEPYSIGVRQDDGSYTWAGYSRYDPISGILAMWADIRDTVLKMDDPEAEENLLLDGSLATVHYMGDSQPMLQFVSELSDAMGASYESAADKAERIGEVLQKQAVSTTMVVAQSAVTGGMYPQSLAASIERYVDPFKKSTMPTDQYDYLSGPGYRISLRGAYEGIQQARSRNSLFSDKNFVQHNDWFEPMKQSTGDFTAFLPVRIQNKKFNGINVELEKIGGGFERLKRNMGESMIKLNDQQMERYKELYNYPSRSVFAMEVLAGIGPEELASMSDEDKKKVMAEIEADYPSRADFLMDYINSDLYNLTVDENTGEIRPTEKGEKLERLRTENSRYVSMAKKLMLLENPRLQELMNQRDMFKQKTGKAPKALPLTEQTLQKLQPQP